MVIATLTLKKLKDIICSFYDKVAFFEYSLLWFLNLESGQFTNILFMITPT